MLKEVNHVFSLFVCVLLGFLLVGCNGSQATPTDPGSIPIAENSPTASPIPTLMPTSTPSPIPKIAMSPTPTPIPAYEAIRKIEYNNGMLLDIYRPNGAMETSPTILAFHGGNDSRSRFSSLGTHLAEMGYTLVAIDYHDTVEFAYPLSVQDAFCALAWVHANAETYQFDTSHLFALGHSAGGTLAAMLGTVDKPATFKVNCPYDLPASHNLVGIITYTGIFDYAKMSKYGSTAMNDYLVQYLGGTKNDIPDMWEQASPLSWVDGSEPPFLLLHGDADANIPPYQSQDFADALEAMGVRAELLLVPGVEHMRLMMDTSATDAVYAFVAEFSTSE